jgi:hypothetical protein
VQKHELTRLIDTDGNGDADLFECLNNSWGYTGNYHDFSFGPSVDPAGNLYVMRNGNRGVYDVPFMGWCLRLTPNGRTAQPFCDGLRSPNGFGNYQGDIFMTENQGNWVGACKLSHMQGGKFFGFPSTTPAPKEQFDNPNSSIILNLSRPQPFGFLTRWPSPSVALIRFRMAGLAPSPGNSWWAISRTPS